MKRDPGAHWRVLAQDGSDRVSLESSGRPPFDEIVVGHVPGACWLHVERMGARDWFVQLGGAIFNVRVAPDGTAKVRLTEGELEWMTGRITGGRE